MEVTRIIDWISNPGIAALLGGALSFLATYYFNYRQRRIQNQRLRRALISEIKQIKPTEIEQELNMDRDLESRQIAALTLYEAGHLDEDNQSLHIADKTIANNLQEKSTLLLNTAVFNNNLSNIGCLHQEQIPEVIEFYNRVALLRKSIIDVEDHAFMEDDFDNIKENLEERILELKKQQKKTLNALRDNKYNSPIKSKVSQFI